MTAVSNRIDGLVYRTVTCDQANCRAVAVGEGRDAGDAIDEVRAAGWTSMMGFGDRCPLHRPPPQFFRVNTVSHTDLAAVDTAQD